MSWEMLSVGEITNVVTKGTTPKIFADTGINYIKAEALNGDSTLDPKGIYFIDEQTHKLLRRSQLKDGDVLLTIAGAKIGKCGCVMATNLPANTNQAVGIMRPNKRKVISKFLYYFFKQKKTFRFIQGLNSQAAQPNINLTMLKQIKLSVPDIVNQHKIASVLSAYDDLIENNQRRIKLLEESARLLYKEWFVHLCFPGHEHIKIVDGVPEGWKRKTLGELTSCLKRGITPKYADDGEYTVINQKCIRNRLLTLDLARKQSKLYKTEKAVLKGDILVNSTGTGTLGRVAQCWKETENTTVDTHVTIVRSLEDIPNWWFGYAVMEFEALFEGMGEGATNQKELKRAYMAEVPVLLATKELMETFHRIVSDSISQIVNLSEQNKKLAQARDILLPRLMNGEIKV